MKTRRYFLALGLAAILGHQINAVSDAREWTDASGKFRVEADFVDFHGNTVELKKKDGTLIRVPLDRLSKVDNDHARSEIAKVLKARFSEFLSSYEQAYRDKRLKPSAEDALAGVPLAPKCVVGRLAFIHRHVLANGRIVRSGPYKFLAHVSLENVASQPSEVGTVLIVEAISQKVGEWAPQLSVPALGGPRVPGVLFHYNLTLVDVSTNTVVGAQIFHDVRVQTMPNVPPIACYESVKSEEVYEGTDAGWKGLADFLQHLRVTEHTQNEKQRNH